MENQNIIINVQSCASSTHITQMPWIGLKNLSKNNAHAPRSIVQCTVFKHNNLSARDTYKYLILLKE